MQTSARFCSGTATPTPEKQELGSSNSWRKNPFCRFTQITALRFLTGKILGKETKCMSEASDLWDRIWADNCVVLFAAPEDIDKEFRSKSRLSS